MIVNCIAEVARTKGKTVGQVSQEAGIRYNTVLNLFRGQGRRIDLDTIDAICRVLMAQPGELFQWRPDTPAADKESQQETE